jgi:hypothetical protein
MINLSISEITTKLHNKSKYLLFFLIFMFSILYCYFATLPKHGDFWGLMAIANYGASENFNVYQFGIDNWGSFLAMHPPTFYLIQGIWLKLGAIFSIINLNGTSISDLHFLQSWGMIPYLFALFSSIVISYFTLKNKWICLLWFGTFSFVSMIIMGQTDIFCTLLIYVSLLLFLQSFNNERFFLFLLLSFSVLGFSMTIKPFGGLLIPIYLLFSLAILSFHLKSKNKVYGAICLFLVVFCLSNLIIWLPYQEYFFALMFSGESSWLFNLQIGPTGLPPYHVISIWLFGYIIILYDMLKRSKPANNFQLKKLFIFYIFSVIIWFFISVYTHPQWWILLIPPMLLVLDNFHNKFYYFFYVGVSVLFLLYTMQWINNIDTYLKFYMPIIPVTGNFAIIIVTLISAIFLLWLYELRQEINETSEKSFEVITNSGCFPISKVGPIFPAILLIILFFIVLIIPPSIPGISQSVNNQPVGEITGATIIGQTFYSTLPDLNSINVLMATYMRTNSKDVIFHLRESPESSNDIVTVRVNAKKISDNSNYNFKFSPIHDSVNKSYYFFLESPDSVPGNAITIWSSKEDAYPRGSLYINKKAEPGDLTFSVDYLYSRK